GTRPGRRRLPEQARTGRRPASRSRAARRNGFDASSSRLGVLAVRRPIYPDRVFLGLRRLKSGSSPSARITPDDVPALLQPPPLSRVVSLPTPLVKRTTWKPLSWLVNQICSSSPCQMNREFAEDQSGVGSKRRPNSGR